MLIFRHGRVSAVQILKFFVEPQTFSAGIISMQIARKFHRSEPCVAA